MALLPGGRGALTAVSRTAGRFKKKINANSKIIIPKDCAALRG
jgi:hypothetical protein